MALVAQMVERKTLNLVVVGSSPTEGAFFFVRNSWITQYDFGLKVLVSGRVLHLTQQLSWRSWQRVGLIIPRSPVRSRSKAV